MDELESPRLSEFIAWLEVHAKGVIVAVACLLVAILVVVSYLFFQYQRDRKASEALMELPSMVRGRTLNQQPDPAGYIRIAQQYSGTPAAAQALLMAGTLYFDRHDFSNAQEQFENLVQKYPDSPFATQAAFGRAACLDAQNKSQQALQAYLSVAQNYAGSPVADQANLAAARLYGMEKQYQKALNLYDQLSNPTQPSPWYSEARLEKEALLRQHPELAPAPTPPSGGPASGLTGTNVSLLSRTNAEKVLKTNSLPVIRAPKASPAPVGGTTTNGPAQKPGAP